MRMEETILQYQKETRHKILQKKEKNKMGNFNLDALQKNLGMDGLNMDDADFNLKKTVEETVIEDVIVLNAGKKNKVTVPEGYEKLDGDLNQGAGGDYIYLAVKRGTDKAKAVNGLAVAVGKNSKAAAPAGFEKIDMDLNKGAGGKYIYLCKRKGQEGLFVILRLSVQTRPIPLRQTDIRLSDRI